MPITLARRTAWRAAVRILMVTDIAPSLTAPAPTMVAARKGKNMVDPFVVVLRENRGQKMGSGNGESPAHPKTGRAFVRYRNCVTTLSDY